MNLDYDEDVRLPGFGLGGTYYFMPVNVYLSGAIGIAKVGFSGPDADSDGTDFGLALDAMVGKEWWVAPDWGLGLAGQLIFISAEDESIYGSMTGLAINALLTATYN